MSAEKADKAILIASGVYTDEALRFAQGKPLELADGAQLAEMLRQFQSSMRQALARSKIVASTPSQPVPSATAPARPICPRYGSEMVLRRDYAPPVNGPRGWAAGARI
jgi:restriction system protein